MQFFTKALLLPALSCSMLLNGCGGRGDLPDLAKVRGQVLLDGAPLNAALVTFEPTNGRPSYGRTDANGNYLLSYRSNMPGAAIGGHQVRISTNLMLENPATGESRLVPEKVPPQYNRDTVLTAEVYKGDNEISFDIKSGKK